MRVGNSEKHIDLLDLAQASLGEDSLSRTRDLGMPRRSVSTTYFGVDVGYLLYSASFTRPTMLRGYDAAVRALAEFFDKLVFGVDHESRIKCCEGVTLHDLSDSDKQGMWEEEEMVSDGALGLGLSSCIDERRSPRRSSRVLVDHH